MYALVIQDLRVFYFYDFGRFRLEFAQFNSESGEIINNEPTLAPQPSSCAHITNQQMERPGGGFRAQAVGVIDNERFVLSTKP